MKKLYFIACIILSVILGVSLILSIYIGFTGSNPNSALFGRILVLFLLGIMAVLTVVCVVFSQVGGKTVYKIGFYILHCGLIVLTVGFLLTNLTGEKHIVQLRTGSAKDSFSIFRFEDGNSFSFSERMGLESVTADYYNDGSPKYYEAVLAFYDRATLNKTGEKTLTVNHPLRVDGYKIYLMSEDADNGIATLLFKYNPGEYVVLIGIVTLFAGTFVMCFSGFERKRKGGRQT